MIIHAYHGTLHEIDACPENYYGYVYRIDILDFPGDYYIGQQKGLYNLTYFGSGKRISKYTQKHGTANLKKSLLGVADSREDLNLLEELLIGDNFKTDRHCWNLVQGGAYGELSPEIQKIIAEKNRGKKRTEEQRRRFSIAQKLSKNHPKGFKRSEEYKKKISESLKGKTFDNTRKARIAKTTSKQNIGRHWFTDGTKSIFTYSCPDGFYPGTSHRVSEEHKKKLSDLRKGKKRPESVGLAVSKALKGRHHYNNGTRDVLAFECPEGFVAGRLKL